VTGIEPDVGDGAMAVALAHRRLAEIREEQAQAATQCA